MNQIQQVSQMQAGLILAESPKECADLASKAQAILSYAKHINLSRTECNRIVRFRIDCMRKAGEMIMASGIGRGRKSLTSRDLGVDHNDSALWQRIARIDEATIERFAGECDAEGAELTIAGLMRYLKLAAASAKKEAASGAVDPDEVVESDIGKLVERCGSGDSEKFACVYADPPWQYGNQGTRAATDNHYPTMGLDEICALPVKDIAADSAHIHLWTTNAFLFDARRVMEAWGFTYKSCFVWVKPQMGIGNYWRVSHEFMLFGIRGECPFLAHDEMSWAQLPRGEHSAKPDKIRRLIEKVSPGPRIELFSREKFDGWSAWGNQVRNNLFTAPRRDAV